MGRGRETKEAGGITFFIETFEEIAKEEIEVGSLRSEVLHLFALFRDDGRAAEKEVGQRKKEDFLARNLLP